MLTDFKRGWLDLDTPAKFWSLLYLAGKVVGLGSLGRAKESILKEGDEKIIL